MRRVISILALSTIVLAVLAGCGKKGDDVTGPDGEARCASAA